jgi:hypothetical protein
MSDSPETPLEARPRLDLEYEDPHYHDEDEAAPAEDREQHSTRPAVSGPRKPARRLPPPPRRFHED